VREKAWGDCMDAGGGAVQEQLPRGKYKTLFCNLSLLCKFKEKKNNEEESIFIPLIPTFSPEGIMS